MARPKIVMKDKLYIPAKFLQEDKVVRAYTHYEFDDNVCRACDLRESRPCADCRSCEWGGLKQSFNMAGYRVVGKIPYYTFPLGDLDNVERKLKLDLDKFDFVDLTVRRAFTYPIEFTGELFDYQETPVALMVKHKMGILKSKPRTGKTVMAVAAAVRNKNRTIIMADQKDFLDGFYETLEAMTNLPALEEQTGKKLFGFPKTLKDYETFQIILITYQQLIKDTKISRKRMSLLRKFYGALIVDEVHRSATPTFSKVLSRITARMRIGLSATPQRKDKREVLPYHFIGPVIAQTKAEALTPAISVHVTPSNVKTKSQFNGQAGWVRFTQFLARHDDRNMMIVDSVLRDLSNGRNIAIPIMYKEHAAKLKKEIDFAYGSEICALFMGGAKNAKLRKGIVDAARAGKVRVVIGVRKLIQIGINIPQWDTLYSIMPMNNAPNWEQESYRILTPLKGKKQPMIRMFVDTQMPRSVGCFKSTLATSLGFGHVLTTQSRDRVKELFGSALLDKQVVTNDKRPQASKLSRGMF